MIEPVFQLIRVRAGRKSKASKSFILIRLLDVGICDLKKPALAPGGVKVSKLSPTAQWYSDPNMPSNGCGR